MFVLKSLFIVLLFFSQINNLEASSFFSRFFPAKTQAALIKSAKYCLSQQVGATCLFSCWINFDELKRIRAAHNGQILNEQGQFEASAVARNRLDWFLATTQPIAAWYEIFKEQKGIKHSHFANFVKAAEDDCLTINSTDIPADYRKKQTFIDREAIKSFWPHLLSKEPDHYGANFLYLPLIEASGKFYWGPTKMEIPAGSITTERTTAARMPDTVQLIAYIPGKTAKDPQTPVYINIPADWAAPYGFNIDVYCSGFKSLGHTMFSTAWQMVDYDSNPDADNNKSWYNFGLYKLALMAAKVDKHNDIVSDTAASTDWESQAVLQFNRAINAKPNPWQNIDQKRNSFIEYRIAELFKTDPTLKAKAVAVADVFFKTFGFYTDAKNLGLSDKMYNLPGEDQILAYCFVQSLRNLSAGSISADALQAVLEFESKEVNLFRAYLFVTEGTASLPAYCHKKYYEEKVMPDSNKTNFHTVWQDIKRRLALPDGTDMVSFSAHGAVLSFDSRALRAQHFQDRAMANDLGFVTIDSSYANKTKPFYMIGSDD